MNDDLSRNDLTGVMGVRPDTMAAMVASRGNGAPLHDDSDVERWLGRQSGHTALSAMLVPLDQLDGWRQEPVSGNVCHSTGRFFSVIGIRCRHRVDRHELEWDQPVIEQPEIGILGILACPIDGVMHFCLQAKEEPGNIGGVQLSPTVQATYSNYTGAHGGAVPPFLGSFVDPPPERVIFARLQTEDGGRFLYKSNRNMIVTTDDPLLAGDLPERFIWLTLRQITGLVRKDNLVNACARSILSALVFTEPFPTGGEKGPIRFRDSCPPGIWETLHWLDGRRAANHMLARRIGLNELQEWRLDEKGFFSHLDKRFFRIVGMKITSAAREVRAWSQPIIENPSPGIIGLLVRRGAGEPEILMQAKAEVGNRTTVQLGPTVQFTQGNYTDSRKLKKPFLFDLFLSPRGVTLLHDSRQAEEGARFYRECHRHRIMMLPSDASLTLPPDYRWLPLSHLLFLVRLGEQVNSCARSILSCLL